MQKIWMNCFSSTILIKNNDVYKVKMVNITWLKFYIICVSQILHNNDINLYKKVYVTMILRINQNDDITG